MEIDKLRTRSHATKERDDPQLKGKYFYLIPLYCENQSEHKDYYLTIVNEFCCHLEKKGRNHRGCWEQALIDAKRKKLRAKRDILATKRQFSNCTFLHSAEVKEKNSMIELVYTHDHHLSAEVLFTVIPIRTTNTFSQRWQKTHTLFFILSILITSTSFHRIKGSISFHCC